VGAWLLAGVNPPHLLTFPWVHAARAISTHQDVLDESK